MLNRVSYRIFSLEGEGGGNLTHLMRIAIEGPDLSEVNLNEILERSLGGGGGGGGEIPGLPPPPLPPYPV